MNLKSLIIILFLTVYSVANGQSKTDLLEKIDFNDTTLIGTDTLTSTIMQYVSSSQDLSKSQRMQVYDMILAVDNVLARCSTFPMYKFVYQYLISSFSALAMNDVIDYLVRLPYFDTIEVTHAQYDEMTSIAESYCRVKIGSKAPDIQTVTIDGLDFNLYSIEAEYTILMFWSATCPHCRTLLTEIGKYLVDNEDVAFVSVCVVGDAKKARKFIKKSKINGITIYDGEEWNSKIVNDFAVDMTPFLFILGEDKTILAKPFDVDDFNETIK